MPDFQIDEDCLERDKLSVADLVVSGTVEELELRLSETETPLPKAVLASAEKTGDYDRVLAVMNHVSCFGVEEGDIGEPNMLLWALREGFLISAGQLVEDTYPHILLEKGSSGQNAYQIALAIGADGVLKDIEDYVTIHGQTLETFFA